MMIQFCCFLLYVFFITNKLLDVFLIAVFLHLFLRHLLLDRYTMESISTKLLNHFPFVFVKYVFKTYHDIMNDLLRIDLAHASVDLMTNAIALTERMC